MTQFIKQLFFRRFVLKWFASSVYILFLKLFIVIISWFADDEVETEQQVVELLAVSG